MYKSALSSLESITKNINTAEDKSIVSLSKSFLYPRETPEENETGSKTSSC